MMAAGRRHGRRGQQAGKARPVLALLTLALAAALLCLFVPAPLGAAASGLEEEEQACDNAELHQQVKEDAAPPNKQQQGQRVVDVGARPRTPKLGEVMDNLKSKVTPQAAGAWAQWAAPVTEWVRRLGEGPKVEELVRYGGKALQPGEALAERCKSRRKAAGGGGGGGPGGGAEEGAGLDACALLDVSWSLGRQLAGATTQASAKAGAWLAQEVPRVPIPLHLVWVDLDVEVSPVTSPDVGALILHQRPFWVVSLADALSERLARALHAVPFFDLVINARYDLFYWPDPACPLVHSPDGIVTRAPLTPDGYCAVRPCAQQSSIRGQNSHADINDGAYYCECDLPRKRCRLRAEPLRDFQLLVDEPLASKAFDAQCATSVAYARPPSGLAALLPPPLAWLATEDLLPRYLANLLLGFLLLYLAEPLSESRLFHLVVGAALGLGSGLVLAALLLNHLLRTFKRLQPFSGLATLLSSAATVLLFQRFGRESPFLLARQLLQTLWADTKVRRTEDLRSTFIKHDIDQPHTKQTSHQPPPRPSTPPPKIPQQGQYLVLGSAALGVALTLGFGWFTESEEEARAKPGWLRVHFNGQANLRKGLRLWGLYALLHSCPNPDYGGLVVLLFLAWDNLAYAGRRLHMFLHRSPDTTKYLAQPHVAVVGDDVTKRELERLRKHVQENPQAAQRVQRGADALARFKAGGPDAVRDWGDGEEDGGGRGWCVVQ